MQTTTNAATTHSVTGINFRIGENGLDLCENDVRIYNHILSAAEVHEISQGLVLHYKLDGCMGGSGENLFTNTNRWYTATSAAFANTSGYPAVNFTKDLQQLVGKTICFSFEMYTPGTRTNGSGGLGNRFGAHLSLNYTPSGGSATQAYPCASHLTDTITEEHYRVFSTYTVPSNCTINSFGMSIQPFAKPGDDNTAIWKLGQFKVEFGDKPTNYSPAPIDLGVDQTCIVDSSGYGHNGSILGDVKISSDTARYQSSIDLLTASTAINCGRGGMVTDSITVNIWLKSSAWNNPVSCTEGGGWNFEASGDYFRFPIYISGVGYKYGQSATTKAQLCNNQWHMLTGIYDRINQKVQIYVDGKLDNDYAAGTSNNIGYHGSNVVWIGAEASGSNTSPASYCMRGLFSDFRIYCTALSASDILTLYHTGARVDNLGGMHTFEFQESGSNKVYKTGITQGQEISEISGFSNLKYDPNIYIEPDGSAWVRIFHHNNPTDNKFASTDTFTTGVYKDENRWFNFDLCNYVNTWEFIVKSRATPDAVEYKYRWIQTKNPLNAAYADVGSAAVTKITTTGYTAYSWGGLYKKVSSTYLCANNGAESNWWGAVGAWSSHNGGIPGWTTVITTGYEDVYLRIDNLTNTPPTLGKSTKNNIWNASNFIET